MMKKALTRSRSKSVLSHTAEKIANNFKFRKESHQNEHYPELSGNFLKFMEENYDALVAGDLDVLANFESLTAKILMQLPKGSSFGAILETFGWDGCQFEFETREYEIGALKKAIGSLFYAHLRGAMASFAASSNKTRDDRCALTESGKSSGLYENLFSDDRIFGSFCPDLVFLLLKQMYSNSDDLALELKVPTSISFEGACLLVDISGFTSLSGQFCDRGNSGLEALYSATSVYLGKFVQVVYMHKGDVIAFAGDALLCTFRGEEDSDEKQHFQDEAEKIHAYNEHYCRRATMCALALKDLHTEQLSAHVGVSCGRMAFANLGGHAGEWTFLLNGHCIHELSNCVDHAKAGEVVITEDVYKTLNENMYPDDVIDSTYEFIEHAQVTVYKIHCLRSSVAPVLTFTSRFSLLPTAMEAAKSIRSFVPRSILVSVESGTLDTIAELREVTTLFLKLDSYNVETNLDPLTLQPFLYLAQETLAKSGGFLRQFLIDDKGCVLIAMWGVPFFSYINNCSRALTFAVEMQHGCMAINHECSIGISSGQVFCGNVGSLFRRDFVGIGAKVNLAARLMSKAKGKIFVSIDAQRIMSKNHKAFLAVHPFKFVLKGLDEPVEVYVCDYTTSAELLLHPISGRESSEYLQKSVSVVVINQVNLSHNATLKQDVDSPVEFPASVRLTVGGNAVMNGKFVPSLPMAAISEEISPSPIAKARKSIVEGLDSVARRFSLLGPSTSIGTVSTRSTSNHENADDSSLSSISRRLSSVKKKVTDQANQGIEDKLSSQLTVNTDIDAVVPYLDAKGSPTILAKSDSNNGSYDLLTPTKDVPLIKSSEKFNYFVRTTVVRGGCGAGKKAAAVLFKNYCTKCQYEVLAVKVAATDQTVPFSVIRRLFIELIGGQNKFNSEQKQIQVLTGLISMYPSDIMMPDSVRLQHLLDLFQQATEVKTADDHVNPSEKGFSRKMVGIRSSMNKEDLSAKQDVLQSLFEAILRKTRPAICIEDAHLCDESSWQALADLLLLPVSIPFLLTMFHKSPNMQKSESITAFPIVSRAGGLSRQTSMRPSSPAATQASGTTPQSSLKYKDMGVEHPSQALLSHDHTTVIDILPLNYDEVKMLLCHRLGVKDLSHSLVNAAYAVSGGNAFWCNEIAGFVDERGQDEFLRVSTKEEVGSKSPLGVLIICRLQKLSIEEQSVLKYASIVGEEFSLSFVAASMPLKLIPNLNETLITLVHHSFLVKEGDGDIDDDGELVPVYRFVNTLIHSIIYDLTPPGDSKRIHKHIAQQIEISHQNDLKPYYRPLSYHFGKSGKTGFGDACKYTVKGADLAIQYGVYSDGLSLAMEALKYCSIVDEYAVLLLVVDRGLADMNQTKKIAGMMMKNSSQGEANARSMAYRHFHNTLQETIERKQKEDLKTATMYGEVAGGDSFCGTAENFPVLTRKKPTFSSLAKASIAPISDSCTSISVGKLAWSPSYTAGKTNQITVPIEKDKAPDYPDKACVIQ